MLDNFGIPLNESSSSGSTYIEPDIEVKFIETADGTDLVSAIIRNGKESVDILPGMDKETQKDLLDFAKADIEVIGGENVATVTGFEFEVDFSAEIGGGSKAFFSPSFGNWLPGDPDEIQDVEISYNGIDITKVVDVDSLADTIFDKAESVGESVDEFGMPIGEMRTKMLKVGDAEVEGVLMAGGPGFKIYSTSDKVILSLGKKNVEVAETDPDYKPIMKYVNLKYHPASEHEAIKSAFSEIIKKK